MFDCYRRTHFLSAAWTCCIYMPSYIANISGPYTTGQPGCFWKRFPQIWNFKQLGHFLQFRKVALGSVRINTRRNAWDSVLQNISWNLIHDEHAVSKFQMFPESACLHYRNPHFKWCFETHPVPEFSFSWNLKSHMSGYGKSNHYLIKKACTPLCWGFGSGQDFSIQIVDDGKACIRATL